MLSRGGVKRGQTSVIAIPVTMLIKVIAEADTRGEEHATKDVIGSK